MAAKIRHGHAVTSHVSHEYNCWSMMKARCSNHKSPNYASYGGRGIQVCERWQKFDTFLSDVGSAPSPRHSLDRWPDNDGNYEPSNVRWATQSQQLQNRRPLGPKRESTKQAISEALKGRPWSAARRAAQEAKHGKS